MKKKLLIFPLFFSLFFLPSLFFLQWCQKNEENISVKTENKEEKKVVLLDENQDFFDKKMDNLFDENEYEIVNNLDKKNLFWANIWYVKFQWSKFKLSDIWILYKFSWSIPASQWTVDSDWEQHDKSIWESDNLNWFNFKIWNDGEYMIFDSVSYKYYSLENLKIWSGSWDNISFDIFYEKKSEDSKSQKLKRILEKKEWFKAKYRYSLDKKNGSWAISSIVIKSEIIDFTWTWNLSWTLSETWSTTWAWTTWTWNLSWTWTTWTWNNN